MGCRRAQKLLAAVADGELAPGRRRALDRHLAGCETCSRELATTERVLAALEGLPTEAPVPERLEQATLRRVRLAAAEEQERAATPRWSRWLPLPAFAVACVAVLALAIGIVRRSEVPGPPAARPTAKAVEDRVARREPMPPPVEPPASERREVASLPVEPPPDLAEAPEKFVNLPILRNMEKLEHFDAIQTTTMDDDPGAPGAEQPANG